MDLKVSKWTGTSKFNHQDLIDDAVTIENKGTDLENAEATRIISENSRISAETNRVSNEVIRQENEVTRQQNDELRGTVVETIEENYAPRLTAAESELAAMSNQKADTDYVDTKVAAVASGAPKPVSTVAEMTDTTKHYLYTGTEEGYISGNWYYYNGSAWVSGGQYLSSGYEEELYNNDADYNSIFKEKALSSLSANYINTDKVIGNLKFSAEATTIKAINKNIYNKNFPLNLSTVSGLTFTYSQTTGILTVNGTATVSGSFYYLANNKVIEKMLTGSKYTATVIIVGGSYTSGTINFSIKNSAFSTNIFDFEISSHSSTATTAYDSGYKPSLYVTSGTVINNLQIKIQVEYGDTPSTYVNYKEISIPVTLPDAFTTGDIVTRLVNKYGQLKADGTFFEFDDVTQQLFKSINTIIGQKNIYLTSGNNVTLSIPDDSVNDLTLDKVIPNNNLLPLGTVLESTVLAEVLTTGVSGKFDDKKIESPNIWWDENKLKYGMVYTGYKDDGSGGIAYGSIGIAWSDDLETWVKDDSAPILIPNPTVGKADSGSVTGSVMHYENGTYYLFYIGCDTAGYEAGIKTLCVATGTNLYNLTRYNGNPIISPSNVNNGSTAWYYGAIYHANIIKWTDGLYYMFINCKGYNSKGGYTENIGYATSPDLFVWTMQTLVLETGLDTEMDAKICGDPCLYDIGDNNIYMAYYIADINYANLYDCIAYTKKSSFPLGWKKFGTPITPVNTSKPYIIYRGGTQYHFVGNAFTPIGYYKAK